MNSIFDKTANESMLMRIKSLTPNNQAKWGKMTADQMCKHCISVIDVPFGTQELKVNFLMRFLGKILKEKILNSKFKKNSLTAKEFIISSNYDFETVKKELIEKFSRFSENKNSIVVMNHPFWGKMTYEDWDKLMWNHLDHHLKQFGI
ncbi:DUF1569 domain-containing protein [Flavobacterium sp. K5-23]|uniref:DUF1569 domain-containing protein n=1 Tax=Flavobacterium sp. K5-23 TaxID=2746225 RepID=UPI00200EE32F|nr:DUF1569 domain-containing protein [Flavobacterium sp. K5-23]UQD57524.1 DUF1569 domain-containing protein [Flavobacterium sp. K5-23]